jgi:hypothetical protein
MKHLLNRLKPLKQVSPLEALHLKALVKQVVRQNTRPGEEAPFSAGHPGQDNKGCLAAGTFGVTSFRLFQPFLAIFLLLLLAGFPRFYAQPTLPWDKTIASRLAQVQGPDLPLLLQGYPSPDPERQVQRGITYRLRPLKGRLVAAATIYPNKPSNILNFDFPVQLQAQDLYYLKLDETTVQKVLKILRE